MSVGLNAGTGQPLRSNQAGLYGGPYSPGDCLTWSQRQYSRGTQTSTVPCSSPHFIEITHMEQLSSYPSSARYPSPGERDRILKSDCGRRARAYLGYSLAPSGRFYVGAISPSEQGWAKGSRTMWCGIQARTSSDPDPAKGPAALFTGRVRGQDQTFLYKVGTCLSSTRGVVSCESSHLSEITGSADVGSERSAFPADAAAWLAAIGQAGCSDSSAVAYHGGPLPDGVHPGYLPISKADWDAGIHTVECTVAWCDATGNPIDSAGSLRGRRLAGQREPTPPGNLRVAASE